MKKMTCTTLLALFLFAGCTTISEPKNPDDNLLYGNLSFNFSCIPNNYGIPESSVKLGGIEVKYQNIETKRSIIMTTNNKGEFMRKNVPSGTYILRSLKAKVQYGNSYEAVYEAKINNRDSYTYFVSVANSVINVGKIDLDISITDINYYTCNIRWNNDFDLTYEKFCTEHPYSAWLEKNWFTRLETAE